MRSTEFTNEDLGTIPDAATIVAVAAAAKVSVAAVKGMLKTAKGAYKVKKFIDRMGDKLAQKVTEGPNDPDIFKAIFLAGGPGSGKSFVSGKLLTGTGLKTINSDDIYEYLAKKNNLDLSDPDVVYSKQGQDVRDRAKKLTGMRKGGYLEGRLGVIIDGTGKDVAKVKQDSDALKELGYDTMMLFVNTSLNIAQQRNKMRPRQIPSKNVTSMWEKVQQNIMQFQQVFGAKDFHVVDNSGGLEDPDRAKNFDVVRKEIKSFLDNKNYNRIAKQWLQDQK